MKVLIVDDERHVREAVRYFVPWDKYEITEIYEATNGREAIEIIKEHYPAIIFTDMRMPLMDGVELLEWIHTHSPHAKTIVISGYQDFHYVKPAIVYGGTDYLLKPLNSTQLIEAAEHAFQLWEEEEEERERAFRQNMQLNVLRPLYWDKALSDLVGGHIAFQELKPALYEELGMPTNPDGCRIAVISLQSAGCKLLERFHGDLQLTSFVLANVCNEVISLDRSGYAFRYWHSGADVVLLFWRNDLSAEHWAERINLSIEETYGMPVDIGLSLSHAFPEELSAAFREARQALYGRNLLQRNNRVHVYDDAHNTPELQETKLFQEELDQLRIAVLSGDGNRMERVIREWTAHIRELDVLTESCLLRTQKAIRDLLSRWKKEDDFRVEICYDAEGRFCVEAWQEQLISLLRGWSEAVPPHQSTDSRLVMEIKGYLDQNYHQEMTLQHIAERFYISRENVSRKFKQVTGENLSDYLTNVRVDKAKALLGNSAMRLSQISELVGYEDEKYFSRVFKKATGHTPREYRNIKRAGARQE